MQCDYKLELVLGQPINHEDIGIIYQPTIKDIISYNQVKNKEEYKKFKQGFIEELSDIQPYDKLLTPFLVNKESIDGLDKEELEKINEFDLILYFQGQTQEYNKVNSKYEQGMLDLLVEAMKFFYKKEDINCIQGELEDGSNAVGILVGEDILIDRSNFNKLERVILDINKAEKPKPEKEPKFKSEEAKEAWLNLQKGRERKNKVEGISLPSVINVIKLGGESYIPSIEILNMTIWEIYNIYQGIIGKDSYIQNMRMMPAILSVGGKIDNDIKHFTEILKV